MRQMWKSYHVFLAGMWERCTVYLIYPLLLLWLNYWVMGKRDFKPEIWLMICCSMIVTVELMLDYFVYGGIVAKDSNKLEYLKSSAKGLGILRKSLIGDWIRRVVCVTLIIMSNQLFRAGGFAGMRLYLCIFAVLLLVEAGLIISRRFSLWGVVIMMIAVLGIAGMVLPVVAMKNVTCGIICGVLWMVSAIVGRVLIMRRARGSYYDNGDE